MATRLLGLAGCLLCGEEVKVRESSGGKASYSCPECSVQVFSRNSRSDMFIRRLIVEPVKEENTANIPVNNPEEDSKEVGFLSWLG